MGLSPEGSVVLGIFVGLLSTSIQSIGLTLQRKSHLLEDEKDEAHLRRPPYRRRRWQLGMLMFIISNIVGSTIQITTLPLPVLSTLQASGLVFNSICASLILGESFTRWSFAGTVLVAAGAVLIATFGALAEPSHNLDQLLQLLGRHQFIIWMFGTLFVAAMTLVGIYALRYFAPVNTPRVRLWRGMAFGFVSGILSAHSLLVAKSAVELLVRTIVDRRNQFNRWQSWVILLGLIFFALSQLYYLHRGLKLCSTSVLYPFVFCIYNIIAILDGLIYFKQTSRLPSSHAVLIAVGTVILLSGVLALSWRLDEQHAPHTAPPHTPLTPGMGFIDDATALNEEDYFSAGPSGLSDEEATLPPLSAHSKTDETTPLLRSSGGAKVRIHPPSISSSTSKPRSPHTPLTPSSRDKLSARLRRQTIQEASEIWDELQDAAAEATWTSLPTTAGRRRASTTGRRRSSVTAGPGGAGASSTSPTQDCSGRRTSREETRPLLRASTVSAGGSGLAQGFGPGQGRDAGRRRWQAPRLDIMEWSRSWRRGSRPRDDGGGEQGNGNGSGRWFGLDWQGQGSGSGSGRSGGRQDGARDAGGGTGTGSDGDVD